jgi:hypothetical protein
MHYIYAGIWPSDTSGKQRQIQIPAFNVGFPPSLTFFGEIVPKMYKKINAPRPPPKKKSHFCTQNPTHAMGR